MSKDYKLLPVRANLRDHMTTMELAPISLGEATATVLHRNRDSQGFTQLHRDAGDAGRAAVLPSAPAQDERVEQRSLFDESNSSEQSELADHVPGSTTQPQATLIPEVPPGSPCLKSVWPAIYGRM